MTTSEFRFELPDELIAQEPAPERAQARLLAVDPVSGTREHRAVADLPGLVEPGTLMVFNDTRVRRARLVGSTETGGRVEAVLLHPGADGTWDCLLSRSKKLREGQTLRFSQGMSATVGPGTGNLRPLRFAPELSDAWLEEHGTLPLPPYIRRPAGRADEDRYQTVYARETGSAAAPTAGLHFSPDLLARLAARGIEQRFVTLEVGLGTFLPVRAHDVADHTMHTERYRIGAETAAALNRARREGRPVLAVGTTSLRTLEAAWTPEGYSAGDGVTDLFIVPGYRFRAVDGLFTNFHTPESTLLMLVCAFAGRDFLLETYRQAVAGRYRFFSYGDAMLIRRHI